MPLVMRGSESSITIGDGGGGGGGRGVDGRDGAMSPENGDGMSDLERARYSKLQTTG